VQLFSATVCRKRKHKSRGPFHGFCAVWLIGNHFICPVHPSHKCVIVDYFWLHFSHFWFFFSVSTNFAVFMVEISFKSAYLVILVTELGSNVSGHSFLQIFYFFPSHWRPSTYKVNIKCGPLSWPLLPWYHVLRFLIVEMCEVLCFQNICEWHWNSLCKGNQSNPKCGETNVDLYMGRTGLLALCDCGHKVHPCWGGLKHTDNSWAANHLQELWTLCVRGVGSCIIVYSHTDKNLQTCVELLSCWYSQK
jgi:hypothetical protein